MQLHVRINIPKPISLPIDCHYMMRAAIYNSIKHVYPEYGSFIHDKGYYYKNRPFKPFTFSVLRGIGVQNGDFCTYERNVDFRIRSVEPFFIHAIKKSIAENKLQIGSVKFDDIDLEISNPTVESQEIRIRTCSPICVRKTLTGDGQKEGTIAFGPNSDVFYSSIKDNFKREYEAVYGEPPDSDIEILFFPGTAKKNEIEVDRDKEKSYRVIVYDGEFLLKGDRKYLDFLYQTGLGEKTALGCGMFDIIT